MNTFQTTYLIFAVPTSIFMFYYIFKLCIFKTIQKQDINKSVGEVLRRNNSVHLKGSTTISYTIRYFVDGVEYITETEEYYLTDIEDSSSEILRVGETVNIIYSKDYEHIFFGENDLKNTINQCLESIFSYLFLLILELCICYTVCII